MNKKIVKLLTNLIPNKKLREKIRNRNREIEVEKEIIFIESKKAKIVLEEIKKQYPAVLTTSETLDEILIKKKTICRYGDGEYNLCNKELKGKNIFQNKNEELERRLREILKSKNENILICIPPFETENIIETNENKNPANRKFWKRYWYKNGKIVVKLLNKNNIYGNSFISRKAVFCENDLEKIKKIWNNRRVVFVYSVKGRFDKDKRIFDNILSYEEIFIPPLNAFDKYELILKECLEKDKESIFLISAGPTATVLAYDLGIKGYQALDIGHLPNSYKEFLGEILSPEDLPIEV